MRYKMRSIINGFSADHLSGSIVLNVIFTECQALRYNISSTKLIAWAYKLTGISERQKLISGGHVPHMSPTKLMKYYQ